jgi:hypothetical protein
MTVNQTRNLLPSDAHPHPPAIAQLSRADGDWPHREAASAGEPRETQPVETLSGWPRIFPGL